MKTLVQDAVVELRAAFPAAIITADDDGSSGAFITMDSIDPGPVYTQHETWLGFHISHSYPDAEVYPLFVRPDLARIDGSDHGQGFAVAVFQRTSSAPTLAAKQSASLRLQHGRAQGPQGHRMVARAMRSTACLRLPIALMDELHAHLFRLDGDEHGAVIGASAIETADGLRLLGRRLFLAHDGTDYVPGKRGYRMLTPEFVRRCVRACAEQGLAYLAVHNHPGTYSVAFSGDDMASHRRGYPALLDILDGPPAGALVFANNAVAGDIWLSAEHQIDLDHAVVTSRTPRVLYPVPRQQSSADAQYDRQVRLFGTRGQEILAGQKVGIVGAGGIGSLINEYLARLGVGHLVVIDHDRIEESNCSRLVGARTTDWRPRWLPAQIAHRIGWRPTLKVHIAKRVACEAKAGIRFEAIDADIEDSGAAGHLVDCDAIFLAADTMRARHVVNSVCHRYLIPVWQAGTKIQPDTSTGTVHDVFSVVRHLVPGQSCLWCGDLIDRTRLAEEAATPEQSAAQTYIEEVAAPSVITLNAVAAAHAVNDYLFTTVGLSEHHTRAEWIRHHPLTGYLATQKTTSEPGCLQCGTYLAAGPLQPLPVRELSRQ